MVGPDDLSQRGRPQLRVLQRRPASSDPAIAGLLIGVFGGGVEATGWVIVLNGLSYGAVLLALRAMVARRPAHRRARTAAQGRRSATASRYLRGRPDLMLILCVVGFVGTFGLNFQMTSALMATQVFHKGATEYGLLGSIMAIGSLTGALMAARRTRIRLRLVVGAALAFGVVEIVAGLMPTLRRLRL